MEVIIAKNYQKLCQAVALLVAKEIKNSKKKVLALPTGQTPLGLYCILISECKKKNLSFKNIITFNLDEYVGLDENNRNSYHFYMKENFFKFIDIKPENIFIPDGQAKNLKAECQRYEKEIKKHGGLDLAILGLGKNDHIGFNEPGSAFNSKTRVTKLSNITKKANAKFFKGKEVPGKAITMGLKTIFSAKKIILLASGKDKAQAVVRAIKGPISKKIPASILKKHPQVIFILDKDAASEL